MQSSSSIASYTTQGITLNKMGTCGSTGNPLTQGQTGYSYQIADQVSISMDQISLGGCGDGNQVIITPTSISVSGAINARTIVASSMVTTPKWHVPDFVFDKNYKQMPLPEVEKYVQTEHHLPGIPSESEIKKNGLDLSQMNLLLLQKVEEMTLLQIELKKQLDQQNREIKELKEERAH